MRPPRCGSRLTSEKGSVFYGPGHKTGRLGSFLKAVVLPKWAYQLQGDSIGSSLGCIHARPQGHAQQNKQ